MIYIGLDESGTGAFAGPFTVAAVATTESDSKLLRAKGVRDSKKLSDMARRRLYDLVADVALGVQHYVVTVEELDLMGNQEAWRVAAETVIRRLLDQVSHYQQFHGNDVVRVTIDGKPDMVLSRRLAKIRGISVKFVVGADDTVPSVGAASIVAKTERNDVMLRLSKDYPEYHWDQNYGYGTPPHIAAIRTHGLTEEHRYIKPIIRFQEEFDAAEAARAGD